jgi:hypothetical protein
VSATSTESSQLSSQLHQACCGESEPFKPAVAVQELTSNCTEGLGPFCRMTGVEAARRANVVEFKPLYLIAVKPSSPPDRLLSCSARLDLPGER